MSNVKNIKLNVVCIVRCKLKLLKSSFSLWNVSCRAKNVHFPIHLIKVRDVRFVMTEHCRRHSLTEIGMRLIWWQASVSPVCIHTQKTETPFIFLFISHWKHIRFPAVFSGYGEMMFLQYMTLILKGPVVWSSLVVRGINPASARAGIHTGSQWLGSHAGGAPTWMNSRCCQALQIKASYKCHIIKFFILRLLWSAL